MIKTNIKLLLSLLTFILIFSLLNFNVEAANPISPKDSRVTHTIKDANGVAYKVYFAGVQESKNTATFDNGLVWAGANEGDLIYHGNYKLYVQKVGISHIKYSGFGYNDFTLNASRKMVYMFPSQYKGQPDILAVAETWSSNFEVANLYYIKNGKLTRIFDFTYTNRPQLIGKNKFLYTLYNNDTGKWSFTSFTLDPNKGTLLVAGEKYDRPAAVLRYWKKSWQ
ncbi:hypothetical protein [Peribacillus huizhouensis]|uniref:Uncharacterized protein n=1 Tax=Peribacillus huizhouensis TaxID=1501239 RepID=A0ABR6CI83_9BACI|nr:hypothetical protein [Peribacillus huizhouensis]MBA9024751.1 hypothetical protein [Peribacillus huizhouensis]